MQLPIGVEIERLCSGHSRVASHVWLRSGALEVLTETAAVRVPVTVADRDVDGPIPPVALRVAREFRIETLAVDESFCTVPDVGAFLRPEDLPAPIEYRDTRATQAQQRVRARIALDARLLARVAEAIGAVSSGVILEVFGERDAFLAGPNAAGAQAEALVAPIIPRPKRPRRKAS